MDVLSPSSSSTFDQAVRKYESLPHLRTAKATVTVRFLFWYIFCLKTGQEQY